MREAQNRLINQIIPLELHYPNYLAPNEWILFTLLVPFNGSALLKVLSVKYYDGSAKSRGADVTLF